MNMVAAIEPVMELWAVLHLQVSHYQIRAPEKPHRLYSNSSQLFRFIYFLNFLSRCYYLYACLITLID